MWLFELSRERFPITVNYDTPVRKEWREVLEKVTWSGDIVLNQDKLSFVYSGVQNFICSYATLKEELEFLEEGKIFREAKIFPADMLQFFSFCRQYAIMEVTKKKPSHIVAAAAGSTWKCSHDCLDEMASIHWDSFYHCPGLSLSTASTPLAKGTRILTVLQ